MNDDDDFFGVDDNHHHHDNAYNLPTSNKSLMDYENDAIANQIHNSSYLDAYDRYKEEKIQEGFEVGYRQIFPIALRCGQMLGTLTTHHKIVWNEKRRKNDEDEDGEKAKSDKAENNTNASNNISNNDDDKNLEEVTKDMTKRFRIAMDQINQNQNSTESTTSSGNENNAYAILQQLEMELNSIVVQQQQLLP